jgi:hypothetical protein
MPKCGGIHVNLHTPFSIGGVPKYPPTKDTPSGSSIKQHRDESRGCVSVYIPIIYRSLFWLSYNVDKPPTKPPGVFYVFKLLINGREVVTWCCGEEEQWKGKTMFGLYDSGKENTVGGAGMEKRFFKFKEEESPVQEGQNGGEQERCIELRVCRANVKIRAPREMERLEALPENSGVE